MAWGEKVRLVNPVVAKRSLWIKIEGSPPAGKGFAIPRPNLMRQQG
jgi:hypothetical protein